MQEAGVGQRLGWRASCRPVIADNPILPTAHCYYLLPPTRFGRAVPSSRASPTARSTQASCVPARSMSTSYEECWDRAQRTTIWRTTCRIVACRSTSEAAGLGGGPVVKQPSGLVAPLHCVCMRGTTAPLKSCRRCSQRHTPRTMQASRANASQALSARRWQLHLRLHAPQ